MYALVGFQTALVSEFLFTQITRIWTLPRMYALMSYQFTLLTEFLFTHFTSVWALIPMYIRGIYAFSILHVKLLIHSTLAKTQRLNIRIYFDRKKNNFYSKVYIK